MQIEFVNMLNRKYMTVETGDTASVSYVFKMTEENAIKGILSGNNAIIDGRSLFCYDITGKISLAEFLLERPADELLLDKLFSAYAEACEELQKYLVSSEYIKTDASCVFLDPEDRSVYFAVIPGDPETHRKEMMKLSELLVARLPDHDRAASSMGYRFYKSCIQGLVTGEDMKRIVRESKKQPFIEEEPLNPEKDFVPANEVPDIRESVPSAFEIMPELFSRKKKDRQGKNPGKRKSMIPFRKKEPKETRCRLITKDILGIENIPIEGDLCIVGRSRERCNVVIGKDTVSRQHAKLEKNGSTYDLTDTGSRNGTVVNGRRIPLHIPVTLSNGDEISFAGAKYSFCIEKA